MTEAQWLACEDPTQILGYLKGKLSDRKLRLFACACCRRVWKWMAPKSRAGVKAAEKYADGLVSDKELETARKGTGEAWGMGDGGGWHNYQSSRASHFSLEKS